MRRVGCNKNQQKINIFVDFCQKIRLNCHIHRWRDIDERRNEKIFQVWGERHASLRNI